MGRYDPKYSDEQREAIAHAMVDQGLSAPAAVAQAAQGLDGLDPFTIPESTARDIATEARLRRPPDQCMDIEGERERQLQRIIDIVNRELSRAEKLSERDELSAQHLTRLTKLIRLEREAAQLAGIWQPGTRPPVEPENTESDTNLIEQIMARAKGNGAPQ